MAMRNAGVASRFSMDRLRLPLAALGIFGLFAGIGVWLIEGQFNLWARVLVAAGILFLGVVVALDPQDVWERITARGALFSGSALIIAAAAIGILGLVNVLGSRYQTKWDLTASKQFTLSEQGRRVAETLSQPVKVSAFFRSDDPRKADFEALVNDYASRSGGKLTYEFIDPEQKPGEAIALGVQEFGTIVYQMGDKKQNSTGTTEGDITTALVKLTRPEKKLYFTLGHGERKPDGSDPPDYGQLKQALERDSFKVETLNLLTSRAVPTDADAVVIAGPTNPFAPEEKDALRAYLDGGGKLLLLLDPQSKADFNDLLNRWEVQFTGHLVIDPAKSFPSDPRVPVVDNYNSHATTRDLRLPTFYPAATDIAYPKQAPAGSTVTPLAQTSDRSWGNTNLQQIQQNDSDPKGPLALAVAVEQDVAKSGDQGSATPEGQGRRSARLLLVGTSQFVSNAALSLNVSAGAGNQELFLNGANWLAEQEDLIAARARPTDTRTMLLQGWQTNLIFYSSVLFLPLGVLAAGVAVWWARR